MKERKDSVQASYQANIQKSGRWYEKLIKAILLFQKTKIMEDQILCFILTVGAIILNWDIINKIEDWSIQNLVLSNLSAGAYLFENLDQNEKIITTKFIISKN